MPGNGFGDHAVGQDGLLRQLFVGNIHEHHDRRIDNGDQLFHHHVLAALGNAGMECDVVLNVQITAVDLALHPVAQALDALDVLVGSVQRGHLGHARFQQQAHVHQIQRQCVLVLHAAQVQRVRKALGSRDHIGAGAPPHFHDALAGKQLHRFAHRAAAHTEFFAQLKFIGQLGARFQRRVQNIMVDFVLHLFGEEFVFQMGKFAHGCSLPCF